METESTVLKIVVAKPHGSGNEKPTEVPITNSSTFADVLCSLSDDGSGCIVEKWRQKHERVVLASELPSDLLRQWGSSNTEVQFVYKKKSLRSGGAVKRSTISPRHRNARVLSRVSPNRSSVISRIISKRSDRTIRASGATSIPATAAYVSSVASASPRTEVRKLRDQLVKCDDNRKRAETEVGELVSLCSSHEVQIENIRQQMIDMRSRIAQCKELAARGRSKPQSSAAAEGLSSSSGPTDIASLQRERQQLRRELKDCQQQRQVQSEDLQASTSILRTKREELGRVRKSAEKVSQNMQLFRQQEQENEQVVDGSCAEQAGYNDDPSNGSDRKRSRQSLSPVRGPHASLVAGSPVAVALTTASSTLLTATAPTEPPEQTTYAGGASMTEVDGAGTPGRLALPDVDGTELLPLTGDSGYEHDTVKLADGVPVRMISQIDSVLIGRRGSLRRSSSEYGSFTRSRPGSFSSRSSVRSARVESASPVHPGSVTRSSSDGFAQDQQQPYVPSGQGHVDPAASGTPSWLAYGGGKSLASGVISRRRGSTPSASSLSEAHGSPLFIEPEPREEEAPADSSALLLSPAPGNDPIASPQLTSSPLSRSLIVTSPESGSVSPSIVPLFLADRSQDIVLSPTRPLTCIEEQGAERSGSSPSNLECNSTTAAKIPKSILVRPPVDPEGNLSAASSARKKKRGVRIEPLSILLDAAFFGELDTVKQSAMEVDNISAGGKDAVTALHSAAVNGFKDCVEFLLSIGADPNAIDGDGWTPLHCSASEGSVEVLQPLLEAGCAVMVPTSDGLTPLEVALDGQANSDDPEAFDDVIAVLRDAEARLGVDDGGRVYAAFPYGDGRDYFLAPPEMENKEDDDGGDEDGSDVELDECPKDLEEDELSFRVGACLRILRRTDIKAVEGTDVGDDYDDDDDDVGRWWWAQSTSDPTKSGYVPCTHLALFPVQDVDEIST